MATLVLGTVGRVIGGPIGGLIGTFVGGAVDRSLFGSGPARSGPRLADLSVQSSAYGQPLPRVYGRMRVAGNLVWTAGITESSQRTGGGKLGGGKHRLQLFVVVRGRRRRPADRRHRSDLGRRQAAPRQRRNAQLSGDDPRPISATRPRQSIR